MGVGIQSNFEVQSCLLTIKHEYQSLIKASGLAFELSLFKLH